MLGEEDSGDRGKGVFQSPPKARLSTGGSGELQIMERIVRENEGAGHFTALTRTNYAGWPILMKVQLQTQGLWDVVEEGPGDLREERWAMSILLRAVPPELIRTLSGKVLDTRNREQRFLVGLILMKVQLQAQGLWDVVEEGPGDLREERWAMSILLRAVPPELIRTLGGKETTKEAWETLKVMRVGVQRVREAKAQTPWTEFEKLAFREGEGVESFGIRLTAIVNDLEVLGDPVIEHKAVLKFLRSMSHQYKRRAWDLEEQSDDAEETKTGSCVIVYTREERVSKLSDQNKIWKPGDTSGRPSSDRRQDNRQAEASLRG